MIHIYDPDLYFWELQAEEGQLCAINYENGMQNMILAVDINDLEGEQAVWLFPVPSRPEETTIDIMKGFPTMRGYNVIDNTYSELFDTFSIMRLSQVYTLPVFLVFHFGMAGSPPRDGITVHKHIEKMGLTTELVTAENESTFYTYLMSKGMDMPAGSRSVIADYMGAEYTFVVTWISDVELFRNESMVDESFLRFGDSIPTMGIAVSFPTDTIYFPLKPTSIYGDVKIPVLIYVMDHVTPDLYPEIQQGTEVTYHRQYYPVPDELSSFFNGRTEEDLRYTKIKIETASRNMIQDLWMDASPSAGVVRAEFISRQLFWFGLVVFILCSCLASMLAGKFIFRDDEPSRSGFFLFGLFNFLTLIGFAAAADILKIHQRFSRGEVMEPQVGDKKILKMSFIIAAIIAFPFFMVFFGAGIEYLYLEDLAYFLILFVFLFVFVLPFVNLHYSDRKLRNFVVLFSVLFLVITFVVQIVCGLVMGMLIL